MANINKFDKSKQIYYDIDALYKKLQDIETNSKINVNHSFHNNTYIWWSWSFYFFVKINFVMYYKHKKCFLSYQYQ